MEKAKKVICKDCAKKTGVKPPKIDILQKKPKIFRESADLQAFYNNAQTITDFWIFSLILRPVQSIGQLAS